MMFAPLENLLWGVFGWEPNPSALNERAVKLGRQGRYAEAIAELNRAIAAAPNFAKAWLNRASCRVHLGDYQAAIDDCTRAIELDPGMMLAYHGRGIAYNELQRYAEAHADFDRALSIDTRDVNLYYYRAVAAAGLNWPVRAIADLNVFLAQDSTHIAAYVQRAAAYMAQGNIDLSLADFERVTQLDPSHATSWGHVGTGRYLRGEPALAVEALSRCLTLEPGDMLAANNRGASYVLLRRFSEAEADLLRTIEQHPEFPSARKNLAWIRATCPDEQFRNGREAVELATQALDMIHWDQPAWLEVLAAAYAESGDFDSAIEWQQKAIEQLGADEDSATGRRLRLYLLRQPFRHICLPGEPVELIPGARPMAATGKAENISRA